MQTVLEQGSIDKPLTFDVGLIQLSFITVCSLNTCNISVKLCRGFALQCFSFIIYFSLLKIRGLQLELRARTIAYPRTSSLCRIIGDASPRYYAASTAMNIKTVLLDSASPHWLIHETEDCVHIL